MKPVECEAFRDDVTVPHVPLRSTRGTELEARVFAYQLTP
jgi:hypothetical protein